MGYFITVIFSMAAGAVLNHYFGAKVDADVLKAAQEARDFAYSNFNKARVEYRKLKDGLKHDLDKILSVF